MEDKQVLTRVTKTFLVVLVVLLSTSCICTISHATGVSSVAPIFIRGNQVTPAADPNVTFDPNSAADTQKTLLISRPSTTVEWYVIEVYNPSTVTDLTVKVRAIASSLGGGTRYPLISLFSVPKSQTISGTSVSSYLKLLSGVFVGEDTQFVFSNDTATGSGQGFTATVRLREFK